MESFISFILNPNSFKAFAYSWIPALLILWFLIARKAQTKLLPPLLGFALGAGLSGCAGYLNHYLSSKVFSPESPQFFFGVGLNEELIKFTASYLGLFIATRSKWREELKVNWLSQCMSGALGFAAAENFIYGIDGQGSIARMIPLIAHTCFAIFWGLGFYKASLCRKIPLAIIWTILGICEGIIFHGIYDCVVSEDIFSPPLKVLSWISLVFIITSLVNWHRGIIKTYVLALKDNNSSPNSKNLSETQCQTQLTNQNDNNQSIESIIPNNSFQNRFVQNNKIQISIGWKLASILCPGIGHFAKRNEKVTGFSFFLLSILLPYIVICLHFSQIGNKLMNSSKGHAELLIGELIFSFFVFITLYLLIGFWSAWELVQANKDLNKDDQKRRLTALFPLSTLFFISLLSSFFLPIIEKNHEKSKAESEDFVIKEIPLGITMEIEKEISPQTKKNTQITKEENSTDSNSLSISTKPFIQDKEKKKENNQELGKGVANSENIDMNNMPIKLPETGYIGVQLAQKITLNQQIITYIGFVYPNTSADRAGFKENDIVLSVNGKPSVGYDALTVSNLIRGPLGTKVEIMIYRDGVGELKIQASRTGALSQSLQNIAENQNKRLIEN